MRHDYGMYNPEITESPTVSLLLRYAEAQQDYAELVRRELWTEAGATRKQAERIFEQLVRIIAGAGL